MVAEAVTNLPADTRAVVGCAPRVLVFRVPVGQGPVDPVLGDLDSLGMRPLPDLLGEADEFVRPVPLIALPDGIDFVHRMEGHQPVEPGLDVRFPGLAITPEGHHHDKLAIGLREHGGIEEPLVEHTRIAGLGNGNEEVGVAAIPRVALEDHLLHLDGEPWEVPGHHMRRILVRAEAQPGQARDADTREVPTMEVNVRARRRREDWVLHIRLIRPHARIRRLTRCQGREWGQGRPW